MGINVAKPSILVTYKLPAAAITPLESVGEVEVYRDGVLSHDELVRRVKGREALVVAALDKIDKAVIDAGSDLKIVANVAAGYNNLDLPYARSKGIVLTNTPDVLTEATANMAITLILSVTRRIVEGDRFVRRGDWKKFSLDFMIGSDIRDRQLGIIGLGRIGRTVAEKAASLGMKIAYYNPSPRPAGEAAGYESMSLDQLLASSDIVSVHVPLVLETRHLIDRTALSRMKRSAYLINTSRGPVVDEEALAWALREGIIKGAGLDVYEEEPKINPGLLTLENVVLVPHLGSATAETRMAMYDLAARNVVNVLSGKPPVTPIP
jgi:glyoxylate reductase